MQGESFYYTIASLHIQADALSCSFTITFLSRQLTTGSEATFQHVINSTVSSSRSVDRCCHGDANIARHT